MIGCVCDGECWTGRQSQQRAVGYMAITACIYTPTRLTTMLHLLSVIGPTRTGKPLSLNVIGLDILQRLV